MNKIKNKNTKLKNISLDILEFILLIPTATFDGFINQDLLYNELKREKSLTSQVSNWISSLKQRGYIETKEPAGGIGARSIKLTNKAKLCLLDKISKNTKKDNKFRFVSFDIPEDLRADRNRFRNALKKLGFKRVQDSLWVINKNVGEQVEMAAYEYRVEKYIAYIISEKSDIDGYIQKLF